MTWGVTTGKLPIFLQERQALVLVLSQLSGKAARQGTFTTRRSFGRRVLSYSILKRRYVLGTPSQSLSCCPVLHICPSSFISLQFHSYISSPCPFIPLYIPITTTLQHFFILFANPVGGGAQMGRGPFLWNPVGSVHAARFGFRFFFTILSVSGSADRSRLSSFSR